MNKKKIASLILFLSFLPIIAIGTDWQLGHPQSQENYKYNRILAIDYASKNFSTKNLSINEKYLTQATLQDASSKSSKNKKIKNIMIDEMEIPICYLPPEVPLPKKALFKYLRILIDNDETTIQCYVDIPKTEPYTAKHYYDRDMDALVYSINNIEKSEKAFNIYLEIINKKPDYPYAIASVLQALMNYGEKKQIILPIFRKWAKLKLENNMLSREQPKVKWIAAEALLYYNEIDSALIALDESAQFGTTSALGDIYNSMISKKWQNKGIDIIKKALTYDNKETKMLAALFLIKLEKQKIVEIDIKDIKMLLAKTVDEILINGIEDKIISGYAEKSETRALEFIIGAYKELKNKDAIPILQKIHDNSGGSYIQDMADHAIAYLKKEGV